MTARQGLLAGALLLGALAAALLLGAEPTSLRRALADGGSLDATILFRLRAPRVAVAALAGGGLAAGGAALQALLRNPLAEPYVLGVSGGSALGATVALLAGFGATSLLGAGVVPLAAFAGGLATTFAVVGALRSGRLRGDAVLLAGFVVNALASAAITFAKTLVDARKAQELLFWLTGFVDVPSTAELVALAALVPAGLAILLATARPLHLLALGDDVAESVGVPVPAVVRRTLLATSLVTGAVVAVTGLVPFVGLVVPQALRRIVGADPRRLIPLSFAVGGALLPACDLLSRLLVRPLGTAPPVGAITALLGGPLFLALLARGRRG